MKRIAVSLILALLILPMFGGLANAVGNAAVPVLLYHHIAEDTSEFDPMLAITPEAFREHIVRLLDDGYTPISYADYEAFLTDGNLPDKPIIITLDDGYLSNYVYAYAVAKELNVKMTIFIVAETVGEEVSENLPHFTWEQAREMDESGLITIGSHTYSHLELQNLSDFEINRQLRLS